MTLHLDGKHRPSRKPHLLRYGFATFVAEVEQGVQLILKYNIFVCVIANWRPTSVVSVGRCSCSWACPDCNNFNFTNSFFEDSEIQTENPFDPLNGNNHNSNETTTSSNNTTNNKKTYKQNNRPNFRCILINCQSIKNKATDIEVLNNLHNPDIITEKFSQNTLMFLEKTGKQAPLEGGIPNIQSWSHHNSSNKLKH